MAIKFEKGLYATVFTLAVGLQAAAAVGLRSDEGLDSAAADVLRDMQIYPEKVGGYGWTNCYAEHFKATRFEAFDMNEMRNVSGTVCSGSLHEGRVKVIIEKSSQATSSISTSPAPK